MAQQRDQVSLICPTQVKNERTFIEGSRKVASFEQDAHVGRIIRMHPHASNNH